MPTYRSEQDSLAHQAIERWKQTAADLIDEIGAWRDSPGDYNAPPDPQEIDRFFVHTALLSTYMRQHHPPIDPGPLEEVWAACRTWRADRNADRVPPQSVLVGLADLAVMRLQTVESDILGRLMGDKAAGPTTAAPDNAEQQDGERYRKPAYFKQWNIGDELLRRNATDGLEFIPGKIRRVNRQRDKAKRPVYWYSEPDTKKRFPERFEGPPDLGAE